MRYERDEREMPRVMDGSNWQPVEKPLTVLGTGVEKGSLYQCTMISPTEMEGLDEGGFRRLVREKLQVLGDSLMAEWREREDG